MHRVISTLIAAAVLVVAGPAPAEQARLARARAYLERQAYVKARNAFRRSLREGTLDPEGTREVYRGLAETNAALRRPDAARDAFVSLLLIEPDHYVPSDASPLVREPFVLAQNLLREQGEPSLEWSPPERISPDEPFDIELELPVDVAPSLVQRVEVSLWIEPSGETETLHLTDGRATVDASRLEDAERLLLSFEIFDEYGNQVAAIGSAEEPLVVAVREPTPIEDPAVPVAPEERRWYQQWWFWTIVGAVVVGAAVGIPVGISARGSGDPCEDALGGPCDLVVRF